MGRAAEARRTRAAPREAFHSRWREQPDPRDLGDSRRHREHAGHRRERTATPRHVQADVVHGSGALTAPDSRRDLLQPHRLGPLGLVEAPDVFDRALERVGAVTLATGNAGQSSREPPPGALVLRV